MIEAGIFSLLATTAAITAITADRIYPDVLPKQPTQPTLMYCIIAQSQNPTLSTKGMQRMRLELHCYASTAAVAIQLAIAVDQLLNGYQGTLTNGTRIQNAERITLEGTFDHEVLLYLRRLEFYLYFT